MHKITLITFFILVVFTSCQKTGFKKISHANIEKIIENKHTRLEKHYSINDESFFLFTTRSVTALKFVKSIGHSVKNLISSDEEYMWFYRLFSEYNENYLLKYNHKSQTWYYTRNMLKGLQCYDLKNSNELEDLITKLTKLDLRLLDDFSLYHECQLNKFTYKGFLKFIESYPKIEAQTLDMKLIKPPYEILRIFSKNDNIKKNEILSNDVFFIIKDDKIFKFISKEFFVGSFLYNGKIYSITQNDKNEISFYLEDKKIKSVKSKLGILSNQILILRDQILISNFVEKINNKFLCTYSIPFSNLENGKSIEHDSDFFKKIYQFHDGSYSRYVLKEVDSKLIFNKIISKESILIPQL